MLLWQMEEKLLSQIATYRSLLSIKWYNLRFFKLTLQVGFALFFALFVNVIVHLN